MVKSEKKKQASDPDLNPMTQMLELSNLKIVEYVKSFTNWKFISLKVTLKLE